MQYYRARRWRCLGREQAAGLAFELQSLGNPSGIWLATIVLESDSKIASDRPTFPYRSLLDECIGDLSISENIAGILLAMRSSHLTEEPYRHTTF